MNKTSILGLLALKRLKADKQDAVSSEATPEKAAKDDKDTFMDEKEAEGKAVLAGKTNITVMHSNGTLKAYVRDTEYNLRVMKPAHGVGVSELKRSLERNREMVEQSLEKMIEIYRDFRLSKDPLKVESEDRYRTATKNALVARANIDVLIPLINMRGGDAEYEGSGEGLPIEEHVEELRNYAEDIVDDELFVPVPEPDNSFQWASFFVVSLIVLIVVLVLKLFL